MEFVMSLPQIDYFQAAQVRWKRMLDDRTDMGHLWNQLSRELLFRPSKLREAVLQLDEAELHDAVCTLLASDEQGKIGLSDRFRAHDSHSLVHGVLQLAERASQETALGQLFEEGRLDAMLIQLAGKYSLSEVSEALRPRLISELTSMAPVAGGRYFIGSTVRDEQAWPCERPRHQLRLSPYSISRYPVTHGVQDWVKEGSSSAPAALPVDGLAWQDALEFCNAYSAKSGLPPAYEFKSEIREGRRGTGIHWRRSNAGFRLPTEAEWEVAARANGRTLFAGSANVGEVGWHAGNGSGRPQPVGAKKANDWGLHDMSGNVWEWCWDGFHADAYTKRVEAATSGQLVDGRDPLRDPQGEAVSLRAVARGGSSGQAFFDLRVSHRGRFHPEKRTPHVGLRMVQSGRAV